MNKRIRLIPFFLSAIIMHSCVYSEPWNELPLSEPPEIQSVFRSPEEARAELYSALATVDVGTRTKPQRDITNYYILGGPNCTKTGDIRIIEPLVYLFNFENDKGFALVAGDRRMSPIITLTDCGNLDPDKEVNNPGLAIFLEQADTYYRIITGLPVYDENDHLIYYNPEDPERPLPHKPDQPLPLTPMPDENTIVYTDWNTCGRTGAIISCQWGQEFPFNKYCFSADHRPAYVGCTAVATGQIMYYFGKNTYYGNTYFDWSQMHTVTGAYKGTDLGKDKVYRLLYKLGLQPNLNMDYGAVADSVGSGAPITNIGRTFKNFGYTYGGDIHDYNFNNIASELTQRPVIISGYAKRKTKRYKFLGITIARNITHHSGHTWIIDQVIQQQRKEQTYRNGKLIGTREQTRDLLHCNWGWDGSCDGYYLSEAFHAGAGRITETRSVTWEGIDHYYRYKLQTVTGIRP